jgi:hypothetical protein
MAKKDRFQRKTLLVVGEGDTEIAFLQHLRAMYCADGVGVRVTIRNAQGGGPNSIVNYVIRQLRLASFDCQIAFLDTDIPWSAGLKKTAKQHKIVLVGSTPCFEGLLLSILNLPVPELPDQCKKVLQLQTKADMTEVRDYAVYFSKEIMQSARKKQSQLDVLLAYLEGK